jgi:hypothetical protein
MAELAQLIGRARNGQQPQEENDDRLADLPLA